MSRVAHLSYIELERMHTNQFGKTSFGGESLGVYLTLGSQVLVVRNVTLGFQYRVLVLTDEEVPGGISDLDYDQFAVSIGFGF